MQSNMLELLGIFVQVVELKSFTKAADALSLHRSVVSKAIKQLEDSLGTKLIHRTTRSLSITSEGEETYRRGKSLLADASDMVASFSKNQKPQGRLRVDTSLALSHSRLIPFLSEFRSLYPDIEIVLTSSDQISDLISEGLDCVIRIGDLPNSGLISRRIGAVRMATCAAPSYIEKYGEPKTPDELKDHTMVGFFSENSREVMGWEFVMDDKIVVKRPGNDLLVNNSDVMRSYGVAGLGIIHGLRMALERDISSGKLVEILTDYPTVTKPVSILYPDRRYLPPQVRVFVDWFADIFAKHQ